MPERSGNVAVYRARRWRAAIHAAVTAPRPDRLTRARRQSLADAVDRHLSHWGAVACTVAAWVLLEGALRPLVLIPAAIAVGLVAAAVLTALVAVVLTWGGWTGSTAGDGDEP